MTVPGSLDASRGARGRVERVVAVISIEVVIVIHLVLTPMHLEEKLYIGVLFAVGNGLLLVAMALLFTRRGQWAGWLLGTVVCLGEFLGFVLSRTVGLPMGYHGTWAAETEDYLGLVSLAFELAFVVAAWTHLRGARQRPSGAVTEPRPVNA
ncbi:MAG: hypothetical protein ACJ74O_08120 [Frankiaceae bacterium]